MLTCVIIDDEGKARRILEVMLKEHCPEVQVIAVAEDVPSGVKIIQKHNPDLVFLDIEMPGYTGFQLLEFFDQPTFEVVFTTAYSEYALQAFQVSAIDYLLKPIQIEQLKTAVDKAIRLHGNSQVMERLTALRENMEETTLQKIALPVSEGLRFVPLKDILYLKADGSYTHIFLLDGTRILISKKIKEFENTLSPRNHFFRTHRSYIVNLSRIKNYIRQDGGYIVMENGDEVDLSRERKEEFQQLIESSRI
jgi:two-component system LytT family response regulator